MIQEQTPPLPMQGAGLIPGQATKILHAECGQKENQNTNSAYLKAYGVEIHD